MRASSPVCALLALLLSGTATFSQSVDDGSTDADEEFSVDNFVRHSGSRASIIGDYIYFTGGEVIKDREFPNATFAIDLSRSWAPESVEIHAIANPDEMIPMASQNILTDHSSEIFYVWGGRVPLDTRVGDPVLWSFVPDSNGGGDWHLEEQDGPSNFEDVTRVDNGAYVSTPDAGFVFGGFANDRISQDPIEYLTGYAVFNYTTQEWRREYGGPFSVDGSLWGGSATFVPDFGPNGLIFILGGMSRIFSHGDEEYISFDELHFLDPVTREWYSQTTTGESPPPRALHCVAGAMSAEGTFEIFVYGGENVQSRTAFGDIYALSMPGFKWTRVTGGGSDRRAEQVCAVVGKNQFISWGGIDTQGSDDPWNSIDPLPRGIGIFDMTLMEWRFDYDASVEAYESNSRIQTWYNDGGMDYIDWSSPGVRALFVNQEEEGGIPPDDEPNEDDPPPQDSDDEHTSEPPLGPIVGGTVGGAVAIMIVAMLWYLRRRRRLRRSMMLQEEVLATSEPAKPFELSEPAKPFELAYTAKPSELPYMPDSIIREFGSGQRPAELS